MERKIDAEFESVGKKCKKIHPKEVMSRKLLHTVIKVKKTNWTKKTKNVFCKCVLELNFATINGPGEPSC
jgi:hypothetical protein